MSGEQGKITFYGTEWCSDCRRAFFFLKRKHIPFQYVNIDEDKGGESIVKTLNHGNRSVPTIVFPDGSFLTEPSDQQLTEKLGLTS